MWDELLDEFRALGGTAENIRLGHGAFGRGIFPIDPAKPVTIHVPENLLVDSKHVVFEKGAFRIGPDANVAGRERTWLENYQAQFSWGGEGASEIQRIFEAAQALPAELRSKLLQEFLCGAWFRDMTEEAVQQQFLASRCIDYHGREVVMPIIELINHGEGPDPRLSKGVTFAGVFAGEVFNRYSETDSYGFFWSWGFVTERPVAFSMEMAGRVDSSRLQIHRTFLSTKPGQRQWVAPLSPAEEGVSLPYLLIGNVQYPRLPKSIFYKTMRDAGFSAVEEPFEVVRYVNNLHFLNLLKILDGVDLPMAHSLRTVAHYQLRAIACCYGPREI